LAGEGGISMNVDAEDALRPALAEPKLPRPNAPHEHRVDRFEVTRIRRKNQLNLFVSNLAEATGSLMILDVAFVRRERIEQQADSEGYWPGAPDLVVEVISPGDVYSEVEEKVIDWLDGGARMVIVVNPRKQSVTVYRSLTDITILTEKDVIDGKDVVPQWALSVKAVFEL
jgi:Uma2 family endonuclease